jgi:hypothetical protein
MAVSISLKGWGLIRRLAGGRGWKAERKGGIKKFVIFSAKQRRIKKLISTFVFRKLCRLFAHPLSTFAAFSAER